MKDCIIKALCAHISTRFGKCEFVRATPVNASYKERMLWCGKVGIFRVQAGGKDRECFAWMEDALQGISEPVVILKNDKADSPLAAVENYLLASSVAQ